MLQRRHSCPILGSEARATRGQGNASELIKVSGFMPETLNTGRLTKALLFPIFPTLCGDLENATPCTTRDPMQVIFDVE